MSHGFVRLHRPLMRESLLWDERHEFTRFEAWIDIVSQRARGVASGDLGRGQFRAAYHELASTWCWTKERVRRFIDQLLNAKWIRLIRPPTPRSAAVYVVLNFEEYNGERPAREKTKVCKTPTKSATDTLSDTLRDTLSDTPKPAPVVAPQPPTDTLSDTLRDTLSDTLSSIRKENVRERKENGGKKRTPPTPSQTEINQGERVEPSGRHSNVWISPHEEVRLRAFIDDYGPMVEELSHELYTGRLKIPRDAHAGEIEYRHHYRQRIRKEKTYARRGQTPEERDAEGRAFDEATLHLASLSEDLGGYDPYASFGNLHKIDAGELRRRLERRTAGAVGVRTGPMHERVRFLP